MPDHVSVPAKRPIEPASILIYGPSKRGKSTQFIRAFGPKCIWIVCERGAIWPATNPELNPWRDPKSGGIVLPRNLVREPKPRSDLSLDYVECLSTTEPYKEVNSVLEEYVLPGIAERRYGAVVIDGLTEWVERVWALIAPRINAKENAHGKAYTSNLYPKVKGVIRRVTEANAWVGAVAHERAPNEFEGRARPGAPSLVGALAETAPNFFDIVVHARIGRGPDGRRARLFDCDTLDLDWITGDRFGVCAESEPADLKEILKRIAARQRGEAVEIPRYEAPASEEAETVVEVE